MGHIYAGLFSRSRYRMGDIWGGVVKISNIFGVLEISETVDAGPEPTTEEKMRVPPPPPPPPPPAGVATTLDGSTKKV